MTQTHLTAPAAPSGLTEDQTGLRLLLIALAGAVLFHGGLLPFTHGNTYDAFIHMFFADSYHRSWFDPWEPRWYTGFATTSYPPGTHMAIAGLMHVLPLRAAFVVVQLAGICLLTLGTYRFALLWVTPRPAGFAAILLVLSSSVSETVHLFGQLPTIFSLGVFLNGLPYVYRWIVFGRLGNLGAAAAFAAGTTAAHHVTTIFGGALFIIPLAAQALRATLELAPQGARWGRAGAVSRAVLRGLLLACLMLAAIAITVLPYWIWSVNDPITQVPIPHGSRESFLDRPDLGLIFFVLPWGIAILFLPYVVWKTLTTRLWPLGLSALFCTLLGTGGTTPLPRAILGGAFDVLTLDRFTFWASILILPFLGHMMSGLIGGRSGAVLAQALGKGVQRLLTGGIFAGFVAVSVFAAILPTLQPTQPRFIDPDPIVQFLAADDHDRWRYLTLGFGDQFAYLSAQTDAQSVDGNYHSARRLPDLTRFSVERLENAKYLGVPGLGSLSQFLINAERYHLKFVFSNDAFYDPLLYFAGWTRLNRLQNGVTVWERPDVPPLPVLLPRRDIPLRDALMWGALPPAALSLALLIVAVSLVRRNFGNRPAEFRPHVARSARFANVPLVRRVVGALAVLTALAGLTLGLWAQSEARTPQSPEAVIADYFDALDFRRFAEAHGRLDPATRGPLEAALFRWRWTGGLIASYGKLQELRVDPVGGARDLLDWRVELTWLTALGLRYESREVRTVRREGAWYLVPDTLRPAQTPLRLTRASEVVWQAAGRRQPLLSTDIHRDRMDRPEITPGPARLVAYEGRFSLVGSLTNSDIDPAALTVMATPRGADWSGLVQATGPVAGLRLLPAESTGYRIDFEGILPLQGPGTEGEYDPTLFVPPELPTPPLAADLEVRAVVATDGLSRGVTLNGLVVTAGPEGPVLEGLAVNTGTGTATITRLVVTLLDDGGRPLWVEAGYVETNIYPGQSVPVRVALPPRAALSVLAEVAAAEAVVNGAQAGAVGGAGLRPDLILDPATGYAGAAIQISTMIHDPNF